MRIGRLGNSALCAGMPPTDATANSIILNIVFIELLHASS
jgi:hypothetical protein